MVARFEALERQYGLREHRLRRIVRDFTVRAHGEVDDKRVPFKVPMLDSFVAIGHDLIGAGYDLFGRVVRNFGLRQKPIYQDPNSYELVTRAKLLENGQIFSIFSGRAVILSQTEYNLLLFFIHNPHRAFFSDEVINNVTDITSTNTFSTILQRLRYEIEVDPKNPSYIVTLPNGRGFIYKSPSKNDFGENG